jgi:hypothetical protein
VTLIRVIDKHFHDNILCISRYMWNEFCDPDKLFDLKVEFHVSSMLLEVIE